MTASSHAAAPVEHRNGFGITALIVGIVGVIFGFIPLTGFVALICGVIALIFGLLGLGRVRRHVADNKVMSWFGTVAAVAAMALGIWGITIVFSAVNDFSNDMDCLSNADTPAQMQQCNQ